MNPLYIEHIGIAVANLNAAIALYEKLLGQKCYNIEEIPEQKVKTAFFRVGQTKIELLQSTDPEGPIGKYIEKKGEGIHHIAFAVDNIQNSLRDAESNDIKLIDTKPRKGAEGLDIAFLHPRSTAGVLMEICHDPSGQGLNFDLNIKR